MKPLVAGDAVENISALTSLRFFAALAVVLCHYQEFLPLPKSLVWIGKIVGQGGLAVSFFFLLSGFILFWRYHSWFQNRVSSQQYWTFARARGARIYPVYIVSLLMLFPLVAAPLEASTTQTTSALAIAVNFLLLHAFVPQWTSLRWNPPAWSLGCEFFFYALFPLISVLLQTQSRHRLLLLGAVCVGFLQSVPGMIYMHIYHQAPAFLTTLYFHPFCRLWEFFVGCLCGAAYLRNYKLSSNVSWLHHLHAASARNAILAASLTAIVALILLPFHSGVVGQIVNLWRPIMLILLLATTILCVSFGPTFLSPLLNQPWLLLLGESSYSLYITHWFGIQLLLRWQHFMGDQSVLAPLTGIVLTILSSIILYRWIETPARRVLRGSVVL